MMKLKIAIVALVMICTQSVLSQTKSVGGSVVDGDGNPLPGVSILVLGTSNGVTSDFDGMYNIDNVSDTDQLVFSFLGMISQTITADRSTIDVIMEASSEALEEVVVVGYGSQSRAEVTGAIASIKTEDIAAIPVANAEEALQGRAAGVYVVNTGTPGSAPVVRIRGLGTFGNNDPLYVIDGVIVGGLDGISQNDIESINVLKDASTTAVYGAQGSNGVVMVTTKKGRAGRSQLSFNAYIGTQTQSERYSLLNTDQYLTYARDAFGITPNTPSVNSGLDTDWQDEIYTSGLMQNYDFAAAGGGENSNFRISAGYQSQEGIILETGFERYSFRANSNYTFGKLKIGQTLSFAFNNQRPDPTGVGARSLLEHAIKSAPYLPVYNPENLGGFQGPNSPGDGQDAENPVRILKHGNAMNNVFSLIGNLYAEYEIIEGLTFKTQLGLDYYNFQNNRFIPSYNDDSLGGTHQQVFAESTKNSGQGQTLIWTNSLRYARTFADVHNFEFLLLAENFNQNGSTINASSRNYVSDEIDELSNNESNLSSNSFEYNRLGYLGRLNYNYDNKYIAAFSLRRDASSKFGSENRWGWFYSVALGWNIAKEDFMSDSVFSTLKLRGSYGTSGNDKIDNYLYSATLLDSFLYPIGGVASVGTTSFGLANPGLKWEETKQLNIGIDVGVWNEKLTAAFEYYNNESSDLLLSVNTPTSLGIHAGSVVQNVGSVETKGFEMTLGYNDREGDFQWSANFNLGTSTNNANSLGGVLGELTGGVFEAQNITRVVEGETLFHFYGLVTDGIYQNQAEVDEVFTANPGQTTVQPGDIRFKDLNGDGDITSADRAIIGNPFPDLTYGLNLNGSYKDFDFTVFISGLSGRDLYNTNIYDLEGMPRLFNAGTGVLDRWTPTNPSNSVPRAGGAPQNNEVSDRFVEDGSFTRLKNLTIGYTIPNENKGKWFKTFRVYASGINLITFTDYSGLDPEVGNGDSFEFGIDRGSYPQPKSFLVGLQVQF